MEVYLPGFQLIGDSELLNNFVRLQEQALQLRVDKEQLQALVSTPGGDQATLDKANAALRSSDAILTAFQAFFEALTNQVDGQEHSTLTHAVVREKVRDIGITHLLWLGNLSSGGEAIVEDQFIRDDRVSFWGGITASFALSTVDGKIVAADTLAGLGLLRHNLTDNENQLQYIPFYR